MSLKVRAILVVVIGTVMGLSLSLGGGLLSAPDAPPDPWHSSVPRCSPKSWSA